MTQPVVDGPVQPHAEDPTQPEPKPGRRATPWREAAAIAAAGMPVGLLWWLLAPSGLNLLTGNPELAAGRNTATWLPRDLVLAGLFLLAGCIAGAVVSGSKHDQPAPGSIILLVLSGALGAVIAWGTGVLSGHWWGAAVDTSANASIAFSLRSYAILAIWPAAIALSIFLQSLFPMPGRAPDAEAGQPPA
ncbi:hypothetical protein [Pseudarthrobacter sp. S9]|uniref:hypothetical protein n=1 Tax=Pseudarthrobacter sp. S9 TaxID=3418421 RepID=UPI003D0921D5